MHCVDERYVCNCERLPVLSNNDTHVSNTVTVDYSVATFTYLIEFVRIRWREFCCARNLILFSAM